MLFNEKFKFCPSCGSQHFEYNNIKSKCCAHCNFVFYHNPSSAVAAFIFNANGDLLVCRRAKDPAKGTYDLPGGFVDYNETAEQAMVREIHEELGVEVKELQYLFSLPNDYLYSDLNIPTLDFFYRVQLPQNAEISAYDDVAESIFVPIAKLNANDFGLNSIRKAIIQLINKEL